MRALSSEQQIAFLTNLQRLLGEGSFVATYKYALLMALADIAVERGADDDSELLITTSQIAEKFIQYYWRQITPYLSSRVLQQNTGRQAGIISLVHTVHNQFETVDVDKFLTEKCLLDCTVFGRASDQHVDILDVVSGLIAAGTLAPPFNWIHVDAHDDFWGHFSGPIYSGNFLYECIRRGWIQELTMVFPSDVWNFPDYILSADLKHIQFGAHSVPIQFRNAVDFKLNKKPDFVFLARSPAYTPAEADELYLHIQDRFQK